VITASVLLITADKRAALPAETEETVKTESMSFWFYKTTGKTGNTLDIPSIPTTPSHYWLGIQPQKN